LDCAASAAGRGKSSRLSFFGSEIANESHHYLESEKLVSSCHGTVEVKDSGADAKQVLLIGQPNVGKSVIFQGLTGKYATVSNYPGTTVAISSGRASFDARSVVVDAPGLHSLVPHSEDERVARDLLLDSTDKVVIQVADAKEPLRSLGLTAQLAEAGVPMVLALNMSDEAADKGMRIEADRLSLLLGVPVVPTVATTGEGLRKLISSLAEARPSALRLNYAEAVETAIGRIMSLLPSLAISGRAVAVMLLRGDPALMEWLAGHIGQEQLHAVSMVVEDLQSHYARPLAYVMGMARNEQVKQIVGQVVSFGGARKTSFAESLGRWSVHPFWGVPILLVVLLVLYFIVGKVGAGIVVNFVESVVFGEYINPAATRLLALTGIPLLQDLLVGKYGLVTIGLTYAMAIILPVVGFFFICFSLMEDSGYLPRLAAMTHTLFKKIGLSGKAVLPLLLGLGCDTMATMTTRTLESKKERVLTTLLLALAIPCSAQLAVILALLAGLSPTATLVFAFVLLVEILLVGYLASRVIPGKPSDFVLEIPPIRWPKLSNVATKTLARMEWYLKEAVPLFLLGTLLLFVLERVGFLSQAEKAGAPVVVTWLGLPVEATSSFIFGFLRRDYGAAGFYRLAEQGLLDPNQILVSLVVITLFIPCIANLFVIIKERGWKTALAIVGFVFPYAVLTGGALRLALNSLGVVL
jgi:ferrous iron transport protein B